jgi:putative transposase
LNLEKEFSNIKLHEYIIMPNHIHFIIELTEWADTGPAPTIGEIVCSFKTRTTGHAIKEIKKGNLLPFDKRFWQRNYYEHIIRNEKEYYKIVEYIENNPLKWEEDEYFN